ncbi:hypothetical protein GCM10020331_075870 [Ectobacillus funiculus]
MSRLQKKSPLRITIVTKTKHSSIINKVIGIINEHLGNPDLSLKWVANQMLYMNADYLGKLFKQETGERFFLTM